MRDVDLDYQRPRVSGLGLALLLCGLIVAAAATVAVLDARQELAEAQVRLAEAEKPALRRQAVATPGKEAQQAMQDGAAVALDLRQPWDGLFAAIENAKTDDIALLAVDPNSDRGLLRITAEARQREAMLDFVQRLERESVLHDVVLVEHAVQLQNRDKPVRFTISAAWEVAS